MRATTLGRSLCASALALLAVACGATRDEGTDAGAAKKDGGPPPVADVGTILPQDASSAAVDSGTPTDGGGSDGGSVTPPAETTIPDINNQSSTTHAPEGKRVHFKGVAVSQRWQVSKSTSGTSPYCLMGVFMADPNAASAEYNGVLVVSKSTVTGSTCNADSQIPDVQVGDELDVTGFYDEFCSGKKNADGTCPVKDVNGKTVTFPEITANAAGTIVKGAAKSLPASLPATVKIDQVNSSAGCAPYTMGADWAKYRSVLVKIEDVHIASLNPDKTAECAGGSTGDFCEWRIAPPGATIPSIRVDDSVFFGGTACSHRPTQDTTFKFLSGALYWSFGNAKLLPRAKTDADPVLP